MATRTSPIWRANVSKWGDVYCFAKTVVEAIKKVNAFLDEELNPENTDFEVRRKDYVIIGIERVIESCIVGGRG